MFSILNSHFPERPNISDLEDRPVAVSSQEVLEGDGYHGMSSFQPGEGVFHRGGHELLSVSGGGDQTRQPLPSDVIGR